MEEVLWRTGFLGVKLENLRAFGHKKDFVEAFIGELKIYGFGVVFEMSSHLASANFRVYSIFVPSSLPLSHLTTSSGLV